MENKNWNDLPQNLFAWLLWSFSKEATCGWRAVIWLTISSFILGTVVSGYQLFFKRDLEIDRMRVEDKVKLWDRSPKIDWKKGLLSVWNTSGDIPGEIWEKALKEAEESENSPLLIAVAAHRWIPNDVKDKLVGFPGETRVRISAILNRGDRNKAIELLARDKKERLRSIAAKCESTPSYILKELAHDNDRLVRVNVASNRATPGSILTLLVADPDAEVKAAVARHPNTHSEDLKNFINDKNSFIRQELALNERLDSKTLEQLAESEFKKGKNKVYGVLCAVGKNKNTKEKVLRKLFDTRELLLLRALAQNPKLPKSLLNDLARKIKDEAVKLALGSNPKTDPDDLKNLFDTAGKNINIKINILKNPSTGDNLLKDIIKHGKLELRIAVLENPKITDKMIGYLFKNNKHISLWEAIARCPKTSPPLLTKLYEKKIPAITAAVAGNQNTSIALLKKIAINGDNDILKKLSENPNTPIDVLRRLCVDSNIGIQRRGLPTIISKPNRDWEDSYRHFYSEH